MRYAGENETKISRNNFLKLSFTGILGMLLFLLSGCLGDEEFEEEEDDDGRRRRRRRRR